MRFSINVIFIAILSCAFALPVPSHTVGQVVRVKPKDMTPVNTMGGNKAGLTNNHHGIVIGQEANGRLRIAHVSSNPPKPKVDVKSIVSSVDLHGKIHVGHSTVDPANVRKSNKFPGQSVTSDEVAKINMAAAAHAAANAAKGRNHGK